MERTARSGLYRGLGHFCSELMYGIVHLVISRYHSIYMSWWFLHPDCIAFQAYCNLFPQYFLQ